MQLQEVQRFWARTLGIWGSQWMIVMALDRLDQGEGASVLAIADMMQVNLTFITSQSRLLESKGLIRQTAARGDAGMVLSLSDQARMHLAELASLQKR